MKNKKIAKISITILSLALCIGTAFAMSISATETEAPKPVISSKNIEYNTEFSLMYAVPASTVTEGASVTIYVHDTEPTEATYATGVAYTATAPTAKDDPETPDVKEGSGLPYEAYIFTTAGIGAKSFTDEFYVVAKDNSENGKWSDVVRYSVAEYLYERLATAGISKAQKALYTGAISFGNGAQQALNGLDPDKAADAAKLISNLRYVTVTDGTIDGYNTGVYPLGSALDLKADNGAMAAKWSVTPYTAGTAGETLINQSVVTVTDVDKLLVEFGETIVINYRNGYNTLDKFTVGGAMAGGYSNSSYGFQRAGGTSQWENYEGRGVVLRADNLDSFFNVVEGDFTKTNVLSILPYYAASGEHVKGSTHAGEYTASTGTAFEISFDMKLNTSGNGDDYIAMALTTSYTDRRFVARFYQYEDGVQRNTLKVANNQNGATEYKEFDVNPDGWFHVRAVAYKSSYNSDVQKWYIYINEDYTTENPDPLVLETPYSAGDYFASFTRIFFYAEADGTNDGFYMDNVFCGYTNETEPTIN